MLEDEEQAGLLPQKISLTVLCSPLKIVLLENYLVMLFGRISYYLLCQSIKHSPYTQAKDHTILDLFVYFSKCV